MLTREELMELLHYDPETGVFTRRVSRGNQPAGSVAGWIRKDGYCQIKIEDKHYFAHRLAWLFAYGRLPEKEIDHINNVKDDNRLINLREATHSENGQNAHKAQRDNKSGFRGVRQYRGKYWMACIGVNRKKIYLGLFPTAEDAHRAYLEAKRTHHAFALEGK